MRIYDENNLEDDDVDSLCGDEEFDNPQEKRERARTLAVKANDRL